MKIKTVFIGSGEFAIPILDSLIKSELLSIDLVVTQPDKPVGRKQILTPTPLSLFIESSSLKLNILKPKKIKESVDFIIQNYNPELIIVASYGQIIPKRLIEYPKFKSLNIHGSLLPTLRGAVPVQMAILNGFKKTGVSIQRMVFEMDQGPLIGFKEFELTGSETTDFLMYKLATLGSDLLAEILPKYLSNQIQEVPQNEMNATYCYKQDIDKSKAEITFNTDVSVAEKMIRAFNPWPVSWVTYKNKKVKIFSALVIPNVNSDFKEISFIKKDKKLYLVLKNGMLEVQELQVEGKSKDMFKNYLYLAE